MRAALRGFEPRGLLRRGKIAHGREQDAPGLRPAPGAGRAVALVGVVLHQPAGCIQSRGLDEGIVAAQVQRDDGRGVTVRDLAHLAVTRSARRPEQERCGVQAVDAGLDVADVSAFLGRAAKRDQPQRRIVHRRQAASGGERQLFRRLVVVEDRAERGAEIQRKRLEHGVDRHPALQALRQVGGLCAVTPVPSVLGGEPVHAGPIAAGPVAVSRRRPIAGFRIGPVRIRGSDAPARVFHAREHSADRLVPDLHASAPGQTPDCAATARRRKCGRSLGMRPMSQRSVFGLPIRLWPS